MPKPAQDPWLLNPDGTPDPFASNVDWGANYADLRDPDLIDPDAPPLPPVDPVLEPHESLDPEVIQDTRDPEPPAPPAPEPDQPETTTLDDGTELTIEKEKGQWKGTVASPTGGNQQVYWGKTLKELIFNTLKAQANATKKIREQNAQLKFNKTPAKPSPQVATPIPQNRALTADEIFEIKTQLESDPALALDTLFQKRTGLTIDQLVALAQQGAQKAEYASNQLIAEAANKAFLANNPDYYPDNNWHNYGMIVKWLAKYKLGENVDEKNPNAVNETVNRLITSNAYTAENLEEAFRDLSEEGLMLKAPRQPKPNPPVAVPPEPAPAPRPDSRIVNKEVRPRAALGIGRNDITPVKPPETPKAPSAEDFENMTDAEIKNLLAAVSRERYLSRRSN